MSSDDFRKELINEFHELNKTLKTIASSPERQKFYPTDSDQESVSDTKK
ncbi:hypothetical protein [Lentilactobacillus kisonensis]|uniref:Uncharacterized protein n=1 Tax=Lentilactobacillus kisonensis F0435 TaxID=797516 RepID=H1LF22_9LACO|nr:hypothetical protein [Lentilactobacillus kisonensis]EHO52261.1 hypothetical protein HMPREF9104_01198 [Lentilactobacillus kisonensis F0435]